MSAPIEHRMSYVRALEDVGERHVRHVEALDSLVVAQRLLAENYNALAEELQAEVFTLWTPEERRAAQHCRLHGHLPDVF